MPLIDSKEKLQLGCSLITIGLSKIWGWRAGSEIKSACSFRELEFGFTCPHWMAHNGL
ncbi:hypothetical protein ACRRTK_016418 [Alexandromys fortis]